jgi:hypothetical protein
MTSPLNNIKTPTPATSNVPPVVKPSVSPLAGMQSKHALPATPVDEESISGLASQAGDIVDLAYKNVMKKGSNFLNTLKDKLKT